MALETSTNVPFVKSDYTSSVSWGAILAGALLACTLTLLLSALGAGLGMSSVSPWAEQGVAGATFTIAAAIYLCFVAVVSSALGGFIAARMRSGWNQVHHDEIYFRDSAHGVLAWAVATFLLCTVASSAVSRLATGASTTVMTAASVGPNTVASVYVDRLLRPSNPDVARPAAADIQSVSSGLGRLWSNALSDGQFSASDKAYVAGRVSAVSGLPQAEAEKRLDEVIAQAKTAADTVRKATIQFSLWLTASLLFGALAAGLAAVWGGQMRDGTWVDGRLIRKSV